MTKPNTKEWEKEFDEKVVKKELTTYFEDGNVGSWLTMKQINTIKSFICNLLFQSLQEFAEEEIKEIEGLRDKLICDGDFGCGQKPPFIPRQEATCGSSLGKHLALVSKYEAFSQVLEILKK